MKLNGPLFNGQFGLVSVSRKMEPYLDAGFSSKVLWSIMLDFAGRLRWKGQFLLSDEPTKPVFPSFSIP